MSSNPFDISRSRIDLWRMNIFMPSKSPLTVSLIVLPESSMMSVASTVDPMRVANRVAGEVVFDWKIHTFDGKPARLSCGLPLTVDSRFDPSTRADVLMVVAGWTCPHLVANT